MSWNSRAPLHRNSGAFAFGGPSAAPFSFAPAVAPSPTSTAVPISGTLRLGQSVDFVWDVVTSTKDGRARIILPSSTELHSSVFEGTWSLYLTCKENKPGLTSVMVSLFQTVGVSEERKPWPSMVVKVEDLEGLPRWDPIEEEVGGVKTEQGQRHGRFSVTRPSGVAPKRFRIILEVGRRDPSRALASVEEERVASLKLDGAKSYISHTSTRHPFDVCFKFPSTNTEIWETSTFLKQQSPYFANLLTSEFVEGTATSSSKKRKVTGEGSTTVEKPTSTSDSPFDDSDDETDRALAQDKRDEPSCELPIHEITITSASFTTYRAVLCYLRTGYIKFSKLSSSSSPDPPPSSSAPAPADSPFPIIPGEPLPLLPFGEPPTDVPPPPLPSPPPVSFSPSPTPFSSSTPTAVCLNPKPAFEDPLLAPPPTVSPKSIYRLAHLLEHLALQSLALQEIASQLTTANVAIELFGDVARAYPEVWKLEMDYCVKHWAEVKDSAAMKEIEGLVEREELPGGGRVLMELAKRLRT